ncbi:MAG: hypothetical protein ABJG47_20540 [Ekhidna sp.]
MKQLMTIILCVIGTSALSQSIKDLDFLIGEWEVKETLYPGTERTWTENGKRTCGYYLKDRFIKCESLTVDSRNQKERAYVYFFNYDEKQECFQVTSLAHDFPLHGQHKWFLDKENKIIQAISPVNVFQDKFFRGTIDFSNPDKIVWNGWASKYIKDKEWKQVFNDVTSRKK